MNTAAQVPAPVMITEDSAILRERLGELISECPGLEVVGPAATAAEAWALFLQRRPSAVLLDIKLRDGNGIELLRRIKLADPDCVVVVLTNYREPEFEQECRRHGADFFLSKSNEFDTAVGLLSRLPLRRRRPIHSGRPAVGEAPLAVRVAPHCSPLSSSFFPGGVTLEQTA
jgi:DNA-binding NarL/FixJ family response regulator